MLDGTLPRNGEPVVLTLKATGVQTYACVEVAGAAGWSFVAPEATLADEHGKTVGRHGAGPVWTLENGSSVHGKAIGHKASPTREGVDWLLLEAVDPRGPGVLARVRYIRRIDTMGGKAPETGCDTEHYGARERVPYTATYVFYGAVGS